MAKLTKAENKKHSQACQILLQDTLSYEDKEFVINNWFADAQHNVTENAVFFTPVELAREAATFLHLNFPPNKEKIKVLDLCAGIGLLSFMVKEQSCFGEVLDITALELNPDYVSVGKKILPEAKWITMDVFSEEEWVRNNIQNEHYDCVISNPPFGLKGRYQWKGYDGPADLLACAISLEKSDFGIFILPQNSVPFRYSGRNHYEVLESSVWNKLKKYYPNANADCISVDTSIYKSMWHGASPIVELVQISNQIGE